MLIKKGYIENFPWIKLNQYEDFYITDYEFSYLGQYMNDDQVFIMTVKDTREDLVIKELQYYMVYDEFLWKIIDVK